MHFDTIVAPITGMQPAAVAIVRVSGPESWEVAARVFPSWPASPESHKAHYGRFVIDDDGLALPFSEGHSYTGEQAVEFSIHGSPASVQALVAACIHEGARMARPGEFTERAFLNGRMDLTQAEGVRDTVEAETARQLEMANELRSGALRTEIGALRDMLIKLLSAVEASVDFSEEIGDLDVAAASQLLVEVGVRFDLLLQTARAGRILRKGYEIAIVGPPNAGKSSLLNALLGADRAIVTPIEGTTRDTIEEKVDFDGLPVVLIDTAGLRDTDDPVESIGVQRARAAAARADEIWYVFDATLGWSDADEQAVSDLGGRPSSVAEHATDALRAPSIRLLANKADLIPRNARVYGALRVSALTRSGLDQLIKETAEAALHAPTGLPFIQTRHEGPLREAQEALQHALETIRHHRPHDLLSVDLRLALSSLGEITGETASEDMIQRMFRDFCVGK